MKTQNQDITEKLPHVTDYRAWPSWNPDQFLDYWAKEPITPLADYYAKQGNLEMAVASGLAAISELDIQIDRATQNKINNVRCSDSYLPWFKECYEMAKVVASCKTASYCAKLDPEKAAKIMNDSAGRTILYKDDFENGDMGAKLEVYVKEVEKQLYQLNFTNWALSRAYFNTEP